jgi:dihydrofolate synthase/folylpolyglutamate synthase
MSKSRENTAYRQSLEEMYGLRRFGIVLGLDIIEKMLKNLGNPQRNYRCIHIAGTNGKGSIASALANILQTEGYTVGLYTSPHLIRFNERIRINGREISDGEVVEAYEAVKAAHRGTREATFFEYTTAMALHTFAKNRVQWAVIETGMGGRLDATNIIDPEASVISNISMEHREYLGNTISAIAAEKAGIIKRNRPVVTGVRQKTAREVIRRAAEEKSAPCYRLGEHFRVRRRPASGTFAYFGIRESYCGMKTRLAGSFQVDNAALVLAVCEILRDRLALDISSVKEGLSTHKWPGRLEMSATRPAILIDGAHNLMAARHLGAFLKEQMTESDVTIVVGILDDKPYRSMLRSLLPCCKRAIFTRPAIDRGLPAETLCAAATGLVEKTEIISDVGEAALHAFHTAEEDDLVCIAGSLYVVGEAKAALSGAGVA